MNLILFYLLLQMALLFGLMINRLLKNKDYLMLIPLSLETVVITISSLVLFYNTGTNTIVEIAYLLFGIFIPVAFLFYSFKNSNFDFAGFKKSFKDSINDCNYNKLVKSSLSITSFMPMKEKSINNLYSNFDSIDLSKKLRECLMKAEECIKNGKFDDANSIYNSVFVLYGGCKDLFYNMANIEVAQKSLSKAQINYESSLECIENEITELLSSKNKNSIDSKDIKEKVRELEAEKHPIFFNLANIFHIEGNLLEAINKYKEAININPLFKESKYNLALAYYELGNFEDSKTQFLKLIEDNEEEYSYYYLLAKIEYNLENIEESIINIKKSINLNDLVPETYEFLGGIYLSENKKTEAYELYTNAIKKIENSANLYYKLGKICFEFQMFNHAINYLNKATELENCPSEANLLIAKSYQKLNKEEEAIRELKRFVSIEPSFIDAYFILVEILLKNERYLEGIDYSTKAINVDNSNAKAQYYLGKTLFVMEQYVEATESFRNSLNLDTNIYEVYLPLANCLVKAEKYEEAIHTYRIAMSINPDDFENYYNMALIYCLMDRTDKAFNQLQKAIELNPEIKNIINNEKIFDKIKNREEFKSLAS